MNLLIHAYHMMELMNHAKDREVLALNMVASMKDIFEKGNVDYDEIRELCRAYVKVDEVITGRVTK